MRDVLRGQVDRAVDAAKPLVSGRVSAIVGLSVEVAGIAAAVGETLWLGEEGAAHRIPAEVVAAEDGRLRCLPLGHLTGLAAGAPAVATRRPTTVPVGPVLLGRVVDALGNPLDGGPPLLGATRAPLHAAPPPALSRQRVSSPLGLGVRALDTLVPAGRGQRFGIFAGSGVGKSSLLSMIARGTAADVSVLALVGERGREVREFLEDDLGPEGLARSVVVVATSDEAPMLRLRAAMTATAISESFRDLGADVVLMMDSLTRVAMAQREIGLSVGEPPATRGYPPSVFALLPRLLERAGPGVVGSITGIYTVLVDGDDHNEPIADSARSILDGHVVLDRKLATAGHFPTIDVLDSVSRVAGRVTTAEQRAMATTLRRVLAAHRDAKELIEVGAYQPGANPDVDAAVAAMPAINAFLRQDIAEITPPREAWALLAGLASALGGTA
ncbi:FliI/YscN family ATPase [Kineococcus rubinsiae]|uniref:FliI/YscN family ATPase n=1 Tax=Kineococcus rubinsiae TaxID=2609562 RepID=UPI0014320D47|nr:FliI/YscN family ATPase [Kineococcus rubinsiae]